MNLEPLGDRVIVERDEAADKSAGGIILPDAAKEKMNRGTVRAVGPGAIKGGAMVSPTPIAVAVKDTVLFSEYAGSEVEYEGKKLVIMREDDIFAVVRAKKK